MKRKARGLAPRRETRDRQASWGEGREGKGEGRGEEGMGEGQLALKAGPPPCPGPSCLLPELPTF